MVEEVIARNSGTCTVRIQGPNAVWPLYLIQSTEGEGRDWVTRGEGVTLKDAAF